MSPLPAIPLEVERYIGACLISNHNHQKSKHYHHQAENRDRFQQNRSFNRCNDDGFRVQRCNSLDGWAGGMPLISFVNRNRRPDQQNLVRSTSSGMEDYNLARLAVHTQGAPLILSKTYNHRKNKIQRNQNGGKYPESKPRSGKCETNNNNVNISADSASVASDESYGSGNSDQCLPRIIKPRKRRKKDRKLPAFEAALPHQDFSSDSASPEIVNPNGFPSYDVSRQFDFPGFCDVQNESETPRLHHTFEEVEDVDDDSKTASTTRCQCRYCDPSGQIWDVDKTSYSSFLTPPDRTNVFTYPEFKPDLCLVHELSLLRLDDKGAVDNCDSKETMVATDLEVSTEIVTSLNGHRDLEIKFFSTGGDSARKFGSNFGKDSINLESC
ncbi:hypothetical protein HHI36_016148 [Cryptolaemus montrouzieri]|uniref:Uncharacterized protein n=1 Tax=Cryptolaemus montrouzieri TaxID=559131 RepID=A0ABD2NJM5_9CUCU